MVQLDLKYFLIQRNIKVLFEQLKESLVKADVKIILLYLVDEFLLFF